MADQIPDPGRHRTLSYSSYELPPADRPLASAAGASPRTCPGFGRDVESACRVYRPRDPRKRALWGLLDTVYERAQGSWEERLERG
jgi:hypothetical protein